MRTHLAMTLALTLVFSSATAQAQQAHRPTYVLVHGAFHGSWAWQQVADTLRQEGARVYTPTLTGLGERAHLARPDVGLSTHVQDIVSMLELEDLHDVILVGHSYAGMVITGVAAAVPGRIAKLVYLDAAVPDPGQSFFEAIQFNQPLPPDMTMMPPFAPEAFGVTEATQRTYVGSRLRAQPLATFEEPLAFSWETLANIPKVYVYCRQPWFAFEAFQAFRAKALAWGWEYEELDSSHDAMLTAPRDTLRVLRHAAH